MVHLHGRWVGRCEQFTCTHGHAKDAKVDRVQGRCECFTCNRVHVDVDRV